MRVAGRLLARLQHYVPTPARIHPGAALADTSLLTAQSRSSLRSAAASRLGLGRLPLGLPAPRLQPLPASHAFAINRRLATAVDDSSPPALRPGESPSPPAAAAVADVELREEDVVETFVRGSGPGGQKINKTSSCVQLRHVPSGIVVRCQETRSRHRNRELARRILRDRLELAIKGEQSRIALEANRERARKAAKRRKAIKKHHFKSRRDRANML